MRYSSPLTGKHTFETVCSDTNDSGLHAQTGEIEVFESHSGNPLYEHGPLGKSDSNSYLEHLDGTPFYWLADTWWMGLTSRLQWPAGFQALANDMVEKGFSVIQIVAGLYPDMDPFDERGANEAGFPWDKDLNP